MGYKVDVDVTADSSAWVFYLNVVGYKGNTSGGFWKILQFYLNVVGYKGLATAAATAGRGVLSERSGI